MRLGPATEGDELLLLRVFASTRQVERRAVDEGVEASDGLIPMRSEAHRRHHMLTFLALVPIPMTAECGPQ